jgi:multidrug efflux pump subunit AcrA (membrane-fusion protein)
MRETLDRPETTVMRTQTVGAVSTPSRTRAKRRWLGIAGFAGLLCLVALWLPWFRGTGRAPTLPTTQAKRGEFLAIVRCRGELYARQSTQMPAPLNVPELRIIWLAPSGGGVRAGEPVIRFDPSSAQRQLSEKKAALEEAQAKVDQAEAEARVTAEQDRLDLANAKYEVERATLEVSKAEIISALQAEQSRIALDIAQEKLKVQEATVKLHEASSAARTASLARARDEAQREVEVTEYRLSRMELPAPSDGVIVYLQNYSQGWVNAKPFQVGDQAWPGAAIAEIPNLETLEFEGKLEETDRGKVQVGSDVRVRVDALPELTLAAKLKTISPLTQQDGGWPASKSFRAYAPILNPDARLRPGMAGSVDVVIERIPEAVIVPAKAVFTRNGKPVVHVAEGDSYRATEIEIVARNPDEFAVSGLPAEAVITLVDVEAAP